MQFIETKVKHRTQCNLVDFIKTANIYLRHDLFNSTSHLIL